jgi:hypothetical protein
MLTMHYTLVHSKQQHLLQLVGGNAQQSQLSQTAVLRKPFHVQALHSTAPIIRLPLHA